MTEKRKQAEMSAAVELQITPRKSRMMDNDTLYGRLEAAGYIWDSKLKHWKRGSKSMFKDADGDASGVIRFRFMGHPDDVHHTIKAIKDSLPHFLRLVEVSEEYPNRRGAGVRVYATLVNEKVKA